LFGWFFFRFSSSFGSYRLLGSFDMFVVAVLVAAAISAEYHWFLVCISSLSLSLIMYMLSN